MPCVLPLSRSKGGETDPSSKLIHAFLPDPRVVRRDIKFGPRPILQWMLAKKRKGGSIDQPAGKRARIDPKAGGGGCGQPKKGGSRPVRGGQKGGRVDRAGTGKKL